MRKTKKKQTNLKVKKMTKSVKKTVKSAKTKAVANKIKAAPKKVQQKSARHKLPPVKAVKSISAQTELYQKDLKNLSNGWCGNLNLVCFTHVSYKDIKIDLTYSSENCTVIVYVLSQEGTYSIDAAGNFFVNKKKLLPNPVTLLKKQLATLYKIEANAKIIPVVLLMRGAVQNQRKVQTYLKRNGIQLIRSNTLRTSDLPSLSRLLHDNFSPLISSTHIDETWDDAGHVSSVQPKSTRASRIRFLTQKQTQKLAANIATVAHAGYFPIASGTIGSLIALPIAYALNQASLIALWLAIFLTMWVGVWAIKRFTENKVEKDPSSVIIDEVVGQSIPFALVAPGLLHWPWLLLGFILFRFFDICKFGLVKYFDKQKTAWGVMMDDVMAGLQTAFILVLLQILWILT